MAQRAFEPFGHADQFRQINTRFNSHAVQHIEQIFAANIAGGLGRERTAANARRAGVQHCNARFNGGIGAGDTGVAGIVKMTAQFNARRLCRH